MVLLSKNDLNDITKEIKRELNIAGDIVMNKKVLNDQILQIQVDLPYQNYCPFEKKNHKSAHTRFVFSPHKQYMLRRCTHPKCIKKKLFVLRILFNTNQRNHKRNPKQDFVSDEECD